MEERGSLLTGESTANSFKKRKIVEDDVIDYQCLYLEKSFEISSLEDKCMDLEEIINSLREELSNDEQKLTQNKEKLDILEKQTKLDARKLEECQAKNDSFQTQLQQLELEKDKILSLAHHYFHIIREIQNSMLRFDVSQLTMECSVMLEDIGSQGQIVKSSSSSTSPKVQKVSKKKPAAKKLVDYKSASAKKRTLKAEKPKGVKSDKKPRYAQVKIKSDLNQDSIDKQKNSDYNSVYKINVKKQEELQAAAKDCFNSFVRKALQHIIGDKYLVYSTASGAWCGLKRPAIPHKIRLDIRNMYQEYGMEKKSMNDFNNAANNYIAKLRVQMAVTGELTKEQRNLIVNKFHEYKENVSEDADD